MRCGFCTVRPVVAPAALPTDRRHALQQRPDLLRGLSHRLRSPRTIHRTTA